MEITFILELSVLIILLAARRIALTNTATQMSIYMSLLITVFVLMKYDILVTNHRAPGRLSSEYRMPQEVLALYNIVFSFFLFCAFISGNAVGSIKKAIQEFQDALSRNSRSLFLVSIALLLFAVGHGMSRNWDVTWSNHQYMLMNSPFGDAGYLPLAKLARSLFGLTALLSFALLGGAFARKLYGPALVLLPVCLWCFVYSVSESTRTAGLCIAIGVAGWIAGGGSRWVALPGGAMFFYTFVAVLAGRGQGLFGVANFPSILTSPFNPAYKSTTGGSQVGDAFLSIFQGAAVTGDGLVISGEHQSTYKLLSLSPLPSFIDHFNEILSTQQIRLHQFVPMSAITELYKFGTPYWVSAMVFYASAVYFVNSKLVRNTVGSMVSLPVNMIFTLYTVEAFSYPLRNCWRNVFDTTLLVAVGVLFVVWKKSWVRRQVDYPLGIPSGADQLK